MDIQKENKIIATFMGLKLSEHQYVCEVPQTQNRIDIVDSRCEIECDCLQRLQYDISWDWLMPVVKKCYNLYDGYGGFDIEYLMDDTLPHHLKNVNINEAHSCVIEFIKWFTKTK